MRHWNVDRWPDGLVIELLLQQVPLYQWQVWQYLQAANQSLVYLSVHLLSKCAACCVPHIFSMIQRSLLSPMSCLTYAMVSERPTSQNKRCLYSRVLSADLLVFSAICNPGNTKAESFVPVLTTVCLQRTNMTDDNLTIKKSGYMTSDAFAMLKYQEKQLRSKALPRTRR